MELITPADTLKAAATFMESHTLTDVMWRDADGNELPAISSTSEVAQCCALGAIIAVTREAQPPLSINERNLTQNLAVERMATNRTSEVDDIAGEPVIGWTAQKHPHSVITSANDTIFQAVEYTHAKDILITWMRHAAAQA